MPEFGTPPIFVGDVGLAPPDRPAPVVFDWGTPGYVDNGSVDNHPISLALEFRGVLNIPHLAYRTATVTGSALMHTYWDPPNWIRETVLSSAMVGGDQVGYAASIVIDRFGGPHLAYVRARADGRYAVQYVRRSGNRWNADTVGFESTFPASTGIALDPTGTPHVAWGSGVRGGTIKHAVMINGLWKREIIAAGVGGEANVAIDISRTGAPHISYFSEPDEAVQSTRLSGLNWNPDTIRRPVGNKSLQTATSIEFDSDDVAHICYFDGSAGQLEHAQLSDTTWQRQTIEASNTAKFADIALDQFNVPRVSYVSGGQLKYAERRAGVWQSVTVDQSDSRFTSIAIDRSGRPYIAYYDPAQADAMLAIGQ
ncbi:MAG TPA: hypothetical protein VEX68_11960 [Bryobacteraceae bacterium]|nr:hypothetical protein [Bryobacteraceae bacterium]